MRWLVFGNSGSGKSTWSRRMAERHQLAHLDLDSIVGVPGEIAVQRSRDEIHASLADFLSQHSRIEGCYGELVQRTSAHCSDLSFLNRGLQACLDNDRRRPWEPHRYQSKKLQDSMLENLQAWVASYYERDDAGSYRAHRAIYDSHGGGKTEYVDAPADRDRIV